MSDADYFPKHPAAQRVPCKDCAERAKWCSYLAENFPRQRELIRSCIRGSECVPNGTIYFSPFDVSAAASEADKEHIFASRALWPGRRRYLLSEKQWRSLVTRYVATEEHDRKRKLVPRGALSLCDHDMDGTLMLYEDP